MCIKCITDCNIHGLLEVKIARPAMQIIAKVPGERCISQQVAQIYESGKSKCRFYGRRVQAPWIIGLLQFLNEYIETGLFPTKFTRKMIIDKTVNLQAKLDVAQRLLCCK